MEGLYKRKNKDAVHLDKVLLQNTFQSTRPPVNSLPHRFREGYYIRAALYSFGERMYLGGLRKQAENEGGYSISLIC